MSDDGAPTWRPRPALVAVLLLALLAGFAFKVHCVVPDGGWTGGEEYRTGCYSDAVPLWFVRGLADGAVPYLDANLEYPVLTGLQMHLQGVLVRALGGGSTAFLGVVWLTNAALWAATVLLVGRLGVGPRRWLVAAAAPPVVFAIAHNWDALPAFLMMLAIWLHVRGRVLGAGVAVGLGTAAKLFPGVLAPLLALAVAAHDRRRALEFALAGASTWFLVNLPVALAAPARWSEFYTFSRERGPTAASTWFAAESLGWWTGTPDARNLVAAAATLVGWAVLVGLGWRAWRGRRYALALPMLAWFLVCTKVYSPQFDLWLVPLLALVAPRLRVVVAFAVASTAVYFAEFAFLGGIASPPGPSFDVLLVVAAARVVVLLWIIASCLRDAARSPAPPAAAETGHMLDGSPPDAATA